VTAVPTGAYAPAIIVLLTDGANNAGPLPQDVAAQAAARGVRVYALDLGPSRAPNSRPADSATAALSHSAPQDQATALGAATFAGGSMRKRSWRWPI